MKIYWPATMDLVTMGHIKCLEWLRDYKNQIHPLIYVGLLTDKALKGYKKNIVPFEERAYILKIIANGIRDKFGNPCCWVVPQDSLNPYKNLKKYKPAAIASGDGWEKSELDAIKKLGIKKINIKFPKIWSSSKLKEKIRQEA